MVKKKKERKKWIYTYGVHIDVRIRNRKVL